MKVAAFGAGASAVQGGALVCFLFLWSRSARADAPFPHRVLIGAELGFAFPIGSLERGSRVTDVVRGLVPLGIEVGYRVQPRIALVVYAQYAVDIPKLCATASDCLASLGHDIMLAVGSRLMLPPVGPLVPQLRALFGHEWFQSELSDQGVTSTRGYRGPLLASLQASGSLGSDDRSVGLFGTLSAGVYSHRSLDTPAFNTGSFVDRPSLHFWLSFGFRGALSLW
jgi:hypothetical protein